MVNSAQQNEEAYLKCTTPWNVNCESLSVCRGFWFFSQKVIHMSFFVKFEVPHNILIQNTATQMHRHFLSFSAFNPILTKRNNLLETNNPLARQLRKPFILLRFFHKFPKSHPPVIFLKNWTPAHHFDTGFVNSDTYAFPQFFSILAMANPAWQLPRFTTPWGVNCENPSFAEVFNIFPQKSFTFDFSQNLRSRTTFFPRLTPPQWIDFPLVFQHFCNGQPSLFKM